ncbi:MAG TPA: hypothetical protein VIN09_04225 [Chloroflexota bacterium]|jgi:hypothetical protein
MESWNTRYLQRGTKDGHGAGDHDLPYEFGNRPTPEHPFPFTPTQLARLLILRGRLLDGEFQDDRQQRYWMIVRHGMVWIGRDDDAFRLVLDRP